MLKKVRRRNERVYRDKRNDIAFHSLQSKRTLNVQLRFQLLTKTYSRKQRYWSKIRTHSNSHKCTDLPQNSYFWSLLRRSQSNGCILSTMITFLYEMWMDICKTMQQCMYKLDASLHFEIWVALNKRFCVYKIPG